MQLLIAGTAAILMMIGKSIMLLPSVSDEFLLPERMSLTVPSVCLATIVCQQYFTADHFA